MFLLRSYLFLVWFGSTYVIFYAIIFSFYLVPFCVRLIVTCSDLVNILQVWLGTTLQKLDSLLLGVCQDFKKEDYITVSASFYFEWFLFFKLQLIISPSILCPSCTSVMCDSWFWKSVGWGSSQLMFFSFPWLYWCVVLCDLEMVTFRLSFAR